MKKSLFTFVCAVLGLCSFSQQHKVVADKIVGIVGDKIILKSDITNALLDIQRQGGQLPPNADCFIMEQQLTLKALVLQADKDSILVPDEELEALLDNQIRGFVNQYGSKEALEEIAGRTIYQIKEDFRQSFRERKLAEKMRDKIVENVKITLATHHTGYHNGPSIGRPGGIAEIGNTRDLEGFRASSHINDSQLGYSFAEHGERKAITVW